MKEPTTTTTTTLITTTDAVTTTTDGQRYADNPTLASIFNKQEREDQLGYENDQQVHDASQYAATSEPLTYNGDLNLVRKSSLITGFLKPLILPLSGPYSQKLKISLNDE